MYANLLVCPEPSLYIKLVYYLYHSAACAKTLAHGTQAQRGGVREQSHVALSGRLRRLDPDQRRRVVDHVRGRHERVEGQVVGAALRLVPVLLAREEPQPPPGG